MNEVEVSKVASGHLAKGNGNENLPFSNTITSNPVLNSYLRLRRIAGK